MYQAFAIGMLLADSRKACRIGAFAIDKLLADGDASAADAIGVSIAVIMAWGLWKSLASALLYIDVSVRPSSEALFFFGHLLPRFNLPQASPV